MEEKLSIRVNIAERYYPLKIDRKDEERIRKSARMINDKILQYQQRYTDKDTQDFLAMAALQFVIRLLEFEDNSDENALVEELNEITKDLDRFIRDSNKVL
jgi:cell division protein ZapA (FtsZ GTPase activity inhibitor)